METAQDAPEPSSSHQISRSHVSFNARAQQTAPQRPHIGAAPSFARTSGYVREHILFPAVEEQDFEVMEDLKTVFLAQDTITSPPESPKSPKSPSFQMLKSLRQHGSALLPTSSLPLLRTLGAPPHSPSIKGRLPWHDLSMEASLDSLQSSEELVLPVIGLHKTASYSSLNSNSTASELGVAPRLASMSMISKSRRSSICLTMGKSAPNVFPVSIQAASAYKSEFLLEEEPLQVARSTNSCFDMGELRQAALAKSSSKSSSSLFKKLFKGSSGSQSTTDASAEPAQLVQKDVSIRRAQELDTSSVDDLRKLRAKSNATLHSMRSMARLNCRW